MNLRVEGVTRRGSMGLTGLLAIAGLIVLGWTMFKKDTVLEGWEVAGFSLDGLTAFFLFVLFVGQGISSLYGISYMKEYEGKKSLLPFSVCWVAFLISMAGVLLARNGFVLLLFWEIMSLFSFFLVLYEHEEAQNRKAAFIYLVMTHVGTVFLITAVLYWFSKSGSFDFSIWASLSPALSNGERSFLFICLLIGLGTKAGLVPFHIWLPYAHPVAPSPVSALMSGVMVKVALYLLLRLVWLMLSPVAIWWGWLVLALGTLSAFVGILYAAMEQDVKRLLAYSTVENVGILAIALGSAMLAQAYEYPRVAEIALLAFFWHTLQHLLFKSTMFMAAGNIIQATHTHKLERLGGLLKMLPQTGLWALAATLGLAALPPLGGFWGEWMLFHALWETARQTGAGSLKLILPLIIALLGLVSAMALATMVKWFATAFLGQARSAAAQMAKELPKGQTVPLGIAMSLALLCVLWPRGVFRLIALPSQVLLDTVLVDPAISLSFFNSVTNFILLLVLLAGGTYCISRGARRRVSSTWNCGAPLTTRMQYSGQGVTMPLRILFKRLLGSRPVIEKDFGESAYSLRALHYQSGIREMYEEMLYRPTARLLLWCAKRIRALQAGSIHIYLGYMLVTLVLVLIWTL